MADSSPDDDLGGRYFTRDEAPPELVNLDNEADQRAIHSDRLQVEATRAVADVLRRERKNILLKLLADIRNVLRSGTPTGKWVYASENLTSGSLTGVGRCRAIRVFANGMDGTFNVNGGDTINVRSGTGVDVNPSGQVQAPTVNWLSGNLDVFIEGVE